MIFFDDNEYDNKKSFEKKYGKLDNKQSIIQDLENKIENNKEKKNKEKVKMISKKRKRHDSSDEEEDKKENKIKKEKGTKDDKEDFINKINNMNDLKSEKEEENNKKDNDKETKDDWKQKFIDIEELNKTKNEVKETAKILDDPMKNLLSKNKLIEETNELIKKRGFYLPRCKFAALINRFNIKPGYRWDGFNRSNGFENKIMNIKFNINNN